MQEEKQRLQEVHMKEKMEIFWELEKLKKEKDEQTIKLEVLEAGGAGESS